MSGLSILCETEMMMLESQQKQKQELCSLWESQAMYGYYKKGNF